MVKVMNDHSLWTAERQMALDVIPVLANLGSYQIRGYSGILVTIMMFFQKDSPSQLMYSDMRQG